VVIFHRISKLKNKKIFLLVATNGELTLLCTLSSYSSSLTNNSGFPFDIPKSIEIEVKLSIKNLEFNPPPLDTLFWPPDGSDMKNNGSFGSVPKVVSPKRFWHSFT